MPKTIHQSQLTVHCVAARLYHSTASVWLSVDPLSDKYPSASPYVYCAGNPVRLVDPDGRTPIIFVTTKGVVGHAFITAGEGDNMVVYTYGRYLGGGKGKSFGNSLDLNGKGVLIKLTGVDAHNYVQHQLKDNSASAYELSDASDQKVKKYYDEMFASGRKLTSEESQYYDNQPNNSGTSADARVIDEYDLLENNCVIKTISGAKVSGTKVSFKKSYYSYNPQYSPVNYTQSEPWYPTALKDYLKSETSNVYVRDITKELNIKYINREY